MSVRWNGIYPAVPTQFHSDESLNIEGTLRHIDGLLDAGMDGLILLGTVGENCSLEWNEKRDLLQAAVQQVAGRVPVLTGVAEYTTRLAARFAETAQQVGVDGLMVLPAMVYKSDPQETVHHYRTVARASHLPIMIYNNPVSYGVDITPDMFRELADEPKFVAIKESSENVRRITDLIRACGERYVLFAGVDDLILESIVLGAQGWISGMANAFPQESRRLWDLAHQGEWEQARRIYRWFTPLLHLDTYPKLVQYIKLVVQEAGFGSETTRAPRLPVSGDERDWVLGVVREALRTRPGLS